MNRLPGVYRGTVVDSLDPMQRRRVKVRIPSVLSAGSDAWAPTCQAPGANAGSSSYRVGDEVLVAFESGDPNLPVVLGKLG